MKRRFRLSLCAVLHGLWVVASQTAAADAGCSRLAVEAEASVEATWPEVSTRVHEAFDARQDTDGCARVRLEMRKAAIDLEVVLPDGRSARRSELQPEDVVPVLEGLLVLPAPVGVADPPPSAANAPGSAPSAAPARAVDREPSAQVTPASDDSPRTGIEFSLASSARVGDGQLSIGFVASSMLEIENVLIGVAGRMAGHKWSSGGKLTPVLEFAALGGYRFRFDGIAVSVYAGPSWARLQTSSTSAAPVGIDDRVPPPDSGDTFTPRLWLGTRFDLWPNSVVRTFIDFDSVVGPPGATFKGVPPGTVTRLPVWMLGIAVGATLGTI